VNRLDLGGRLVLVTGGAGALGRAIVGRLRAHGAQVAVNDIVPAEGLGLGDGVAYVRGDAGEPGIAAALLDEVHGRFGRLPDTVCLHAGVVASGALLDLPIESVRRVLHDNLIPAFALAQETARRWVAAGQPGLLLFTSSWVQDVPWPGIAPYSASKAALRSLARSFARELAPHGIRANVIAPGIVAAGMAKHQWDTEPDYQRRARRAIPLGTQQETGSVADTVLYAVSDLAAYMTGATILVDGGASLYPMDED
jgi:NAD(P)-dependent dehydrogenase (short-subunit alcohol dehydrogenase family)